MAAPREPESDASTATNEARNLSATRWSQVVQAACGDEDDARAALEALCRKYWPPLYRFARSRGLTQHDAEDLTQGFFEDLLERGVIARADASRGRFRTFLLSSFVNFHSHQRERAATLKRGGRRKIVSLEAVRETVSWQENGMKVMETPERLFDRAWALGVVDHALDAVGRDYAAVGKEAVFDGLKTAVWGGGPAPSYPDLAQRLGMTEGAARVAVHRLRRRFRESLRAEVAATVSKAEDVDDELRHLVAALAG